MEGRPRLTPSYAELHRATVAICQALRESPLRMLSGEPCGAQAYLAEVLTRAYPDTAARQVLRWCGSRNVELDAERAAQLMSSAAWSDDVVMTGLVSIGRADLVPVEWLPADPSGPAPEPSPWPAAPRRWSARPLADARVNPYRRVIVHQVATGPVGMGEPSAGRSALDQMRAAETAAAGPRFSISAARNPRMEHAHDRG